MPASSRTGFEIIVRDSERHQLARCLTSPGRYVIGQDRRSEIIVPDPSVSASHARITVVEDGKFFIEDLESANGTTIDGHPVTGMVPLPLTSEVLLGSARLEIRRAGLPAAVFEYLPEGFLREHRYELGDIVVEGSRSTIFAARDLSLGREVALKVMRPESQSDLEQVLRFIREAQVTGILHHPHILPIYELGLDPQARLFYTTRFVEGEPLASVLDRLAASDPEALGAYPFAALITIFQKACDAVSFAHACGVVHRDLRAENVTLGRYGEVFIVNWGTAKLLERETAAQPLAGLDRVAASAVHPGITEYSAPEQAAELEDEIDARTDIYALGAMLYRILLLRAPVATGTDMELLENILSGRVIPPAAVAKQSTLPHWPAARLPDYLADLALRALSLAREERPAPSQKCNSKSPPGSKPTPPAPTPARSGNNSPACSRAGKQPFRSASSRVPRRALGRVPENASAGAGSRPVQNAPKFSRGNPRQRHHAQTSERNMSGHSEGEADSKAMGHIASISSRLLLSIRVTHVIPRLPSSF
jgi:serine/threonine protein kinase